MSVFVCITTRDGKPDFATLHSAEEACRFYGDAKVGTTRNAHNVCVSRNMGVAKMLEHGFDHILFLDNDVTIEPNAIHNLVKLDANVATGCVPTTICEGGRLATFLSVAQSVDSKTNAITWQRHWFDGVRDTEACGAACLLIRREVFDKLEFPWFRWPEFYEDGRYYFFSEDIDFCNRVMAAGLGPIRAHGQVRCGHSRGVNVADLIKEEADEWGSHQGVLRKIGKHATGIKRVVEYGCGTYSTPLFLDRAIFAHVESVEAFEHDAKWARAVEERCRSSRLSITPCPLGEMRFKAAKAADLVFIDCGATEALPGKIDYSERALLFRGHERGNAIVVLHDAHEPQLANAFHTSAYKHKELFSGRGPHTAVASNSFDVSILNN